MGNWRSYFRVYYFGMIVLFVFSLLSGFEGPVDVVNAVISSFAFVGAYGFLANVAIGNRGFWQVYIWLSAIIGLGSIGIGAWEIRAELSVGITLFLCLMMVIWLPLFMVIWLYAFVDRAVWENPAPET